LKKEEAEVSNREDQLEKNLTSEKKKMNDTIQQTVKQRRDEIHANYDKELSKVQEQLKKVRSRREKAKNQGIRERISDETEVYISQNKSLMKQLKNTVSQKHLPFVCRSPLYYSLYFPRHPKEFLTFLVFVALFFAVVPCGIYLCLPQRRAIFLVLIYLADLLVVGGLYLYIGNHTKLLYMETLRECREILDSVHENKKKIRRTMRAIKKDRNESQYDLGKFDDEISRLQQEQEQVTAQKKEALSTYENVTKNILTDEIENNYKEKLDQLQADHEKAEMDLKVIRKELKEKNLYISDHYSTHLGKEFMDPARIAKLCLIVQNGQASNVSEAISRYKESEA
jgi:membrane-associated HD superfamily phosphohydrolase